MTPSASIPRQVERSTLENGLRIISEPMPHVRSVSLGIWVGTGARRETVPQQGISHFIEHMLFKGTSNRSAEQIAKEVDSTGGHLDAYTAKELVSYNTKVIDDHVPVAFDVLADMVLRPMFSPPDIEKEKGVILEELKMEVDNPEYLVHETFFSSFWKDHSLGRSILGTKQTIKSFDQESIRSYFDTVYEPGNIVITAAGKLEHSKLVELVGQYFGNLPARSNGHKDPVPEPSAPLILKSKRSLEQMHLCMGVPAYPIQDSRRYACYLLSTVLGGGMSSRLFQNIREKHGLAYSVFSELNLYRDSGCLAVYAGTSVENLRKLVGMVIDEFRRLASELIAAEELRRAKDHLKGSLALSLESTSSRMSNLARQELFFGRFFTIDEMVESIEAVTAEEIQTIAQDFFATKQVGLTALGKLDNISFEPQELVC
ncbi:MAG TPA: pitrilysin family protein [Bryobacteraceae bacterium]|nr:pitrilysin family protein [Bryobacteraceae bacterium]